ncbi:MAG: glycosyltransferase family 2 protein [Chloroflexi bacterium HGW-Chloroflexi-2]|jgi:GT2 family glycosyltransferase|nr:MAG: glycosyltransferase family 2 protein [Chloroflexi bacterium HGW-Chloroflexi-2]
MENSISVIIPIRNEATFLNRCLDSVFDQINIDNFVIEVIIADGLSTDSTCGIIREYQNNHPNLLLIENPGKIVPTGFNKALMIAKGNIIIRIDGHTVIAPDYVANCVKLLQESEAYNVGGRMNAMGTSRFGKAVAIATSTPFGVGGSRFHYSEKEEWVDSVYMGAWEREVFEKIGLFDEELVRNQDDEFNYRLRKSGGKILLSPAIKSKYTVRSSPKALWKQYYQYGFWKVRVLQKHPGQMSERQFIPPAFVASLFLSLILAMFFPIFWVFFSLIAGMYLIANLLASMVSAAKKGWQHLFLLPGVFAILHISYGLGFLVGLVKFANRWGDKIGKVPRFETFHE